MLSVNKLEKVMELEEQLRAEYHHQLDEKQAQIDKHVTLEAELQATVAAQKTALEKQLETITELSGKTEANAQIEQQNRELTNRAGNLQEEVAELKKRVKTLQKDLAQEKSEHKILQQFDPMRMKKNLEANKKKLAERVKANDLLQKSLAKVKGEKAESQAKVAELEAQLSELQPAGENEDPETAETAETAS